MNQNPHQQLQDIRLLMERSTRFMSLSGWTGIMVGIYSLLGAAAAWFIIYKVEPKINSVSEYGAVESEYLLAGEETYRNFTLLFSGKNLLLLLVALSVIALAAATVLYHSSRKAKIQEVKLWNTTSKRLLIQLAIPLIAGGIFCLALFVYGHAGLIAPAMLIFYGIALLNGSKYTLVEFHSLALIEIALGLISLFFIGYGLFFWALGFGLMHIIYGVLMQKRYR